MDTSRAPEKQSALDVAAALLAQRGEQAIDQMKLHKLLYLVQAGSLAWFGRPAFDEAIEAWTWGPVVQRVAGYYMNFRRQPIPGPVIGDPTKLDERVMWLVDEILTVYGRLTGPQLAALTKQAGSPWKEARGRLPDEAWSDVDIPQPLISEYHRKHGVLPAQPAPSENALAQRFFDGDEEALAQLAQAVTGARPTITTV